MHQDEKSKEMNEHFSEAVSVGSKLVVRLAVRYITVFPLPTVLALAVSTVATSLARTLDITIASY